MVIVLYLFSPFSRKSRHCTRRAGFSAFRPAILNFMYCSSPVYLQHCKEYDSITLRQFFDDCFADVSGISLRSATVFIKPNLISARCTGPACTDPRFILALGGWLRDNGAQVAIGDSPAIGKARSVLKTLRIDSELESMGIKIINFKSVVQRRLDCGIQVGIAQEPLEYEYFINAPKVKAHSQMYVTLAVKNIFGIVVGMRKSMIHMRHGGSGDMFSKIILDLAELLPRHFSIIDGIEVMTRQGPLSGDSLSFGMIGFAEDPVALDTALITALNLDSRKSRLWCEAKRRSHPGAELGTIEFPRLSPNFFHGILFEAPEELAPIRFNPLRFLWGNITRLQNKVRGI